MARQSFLAFGRRGGEGRGEHHQEGDRGIIEEKKKKEGSITRERSKKRKERNQNPTLDSEGENALPENSLAAP